MAHHTRLASRLPLRQPTTDRYATADRHEGRRIPRWLGWVLREPWRESIVLGRATVAPSSSSGGSRTVPIPTSDPAHAFRLTAVFASDQVAPLPPPAVPAPLDPPIRDVDGDELASFVPSLVELAEQMGCTVVFEPIAAAAHGYYQPSD